MAFGGDGVTLEENCSWRVGCGFGRERQGSRRGTPGEEGVTHGRSGVDAIAREKGLVHSGVGLVTLGVTGRKKDTHEYEVLFPAGKGGTLQERKVWALELKMWFLKGKV
jgi:hypothetical protein